MVKRRTRSYRARPPRPMDDTRYMTRGMVDMSKMAVTGMVGVGMLGTIGSLIKK